MSSYGNTHTDILVAGAVAALSIDLLVYPLDTIKTRVQAPNYARLYTHPQTGAVQRSLFRGLYQGIGSVVLATVPSSGAFFTTYEATKSLLHSLNHTLSPNEFQSPLIPTPLLHATASSLAEAVSCLILTPAEVLKQNAQIIKKSPSSPSGPIFDTSATRAAWKKFQHPRQLWRGYTALLGRNLPFVALQFPVFEVIKGSLLEYKERELSKQDRVRREKEREVLRDWRREQGKGFKDEDRDRDGDGWEGREVKVGMADRAMATGMAAAISGSMAAVVTTPVDVVKTRIMLAAGEDAGAPFSGGNGEAAKTSLRAEKRKSVRVLEAEKAMRKIRSMGAWAVGRQILAEEGIGGLFRGGGLRGAWTALGSGLYLSVYESGRQYLEERRAGEDD